MINILHIDTSLNNASVCITDNERIIFYEENNSTINHATWLHNCIKQGLNQNHLKTFDLQAISVTTGPGSYTGLRVGMATAKGLCYALKIPLLTNSTFEIMALANKNIEYDIICTTIDARRMEIYYALYDTELNQLKAPANLIINENSFSEIDNNKKILFCGTNIEKLKQTLHVKNSTFHSTCGNATHLSILAIAKFYAGNFSDVFLTEPLYIKPFYSKIKI